MEKDVKFGFSEGESEFFPNPGVPISWDRNLRTLNIERPTLNVEVKKLRRASVGRRWGATGGEHRTSVFAMLRRDESNAQY